MIPPPPATVALIDPAWVGHHATYFRSFIEAFVAAGARVLALCPQPQDLQDLTDAHPSQVHAGLLEDPGSSRLLPGKDHDPYLTWRRWKIAAAGVRSLESRSGWTADFVYFAWLDSYLRFMWTTSLADRLLGRPWAGLYFRNQHLCQDKQGFLNACKRRLKGDFVMRAPGCRLVSVVDEHALPYLQQYTGKPVLLMPDITDETPGDPEDPVARAIRHRAAGRAVIGMVGLEKRKGFLTLLRAAVEAQRLGEPWFFAFTGVLWWETLASEEASWVRDLLRDPPENIYLDPDAGLVPDGAPYNGIAGTFDVFFAAYLNSLYNGSSNVLTKAALLEIPVIVTEGACLEERARHFRLGLAIPEADTERCLQAIRALLGGSDWEGRSLDPRYHDYFREHSHDKLLKNVRLMVAQAVPRPSGTPSPADALASSVTN